MGTEGIKRVMVVGAGTMGHSIAMVFAQGGYDVDLVDVHGEILDRSLKLIRANLRTLAEMGQPPSRSIPEILKRIHPSTSLEAGREADLVVEAITENPKAKRTLFHSLDRICPRKTIFTSNTSYLNIFDVAKTRRPDKLVIAHWYAPPHLIPLVDLVKGPATSRRTLETVKAILLKVGKKPVTMKKFIPGYIVNRLQRAMAREIFYLLDEGYATPEEIDLAVKNSLGIRIPVVGVVQRYDFTGLDMALSFEKNPSIRLVSKDRKPRTLTRLVRRGNLGVKSGKGFYDYSREDPYRIMRTRDRKMIRLMTFLGREKI